MIGNFSVGLSTYLLVGAMLFCIGLYGVFAKRNIIAVLMSIELMLNAVNINFIAFNRFIWNEKIGVNYLLTGHVAALFVIVVAAAEVAVGLALIITIYRNRQSTDVDDLNWLKW
ncbi:MULTISPECIES: NADH-quinone oxidoreductase subunit NuoK [Desulfosporosinus]|uniref:NADH-quinone oxidoreductase subunit K n=2 Tax=Desulfosporosinus TaxID=79206 RepID=A0A1G7REF3_9FIRM|nr:MULTISPECIES: NADH-quinone oxidoreductase subunit NuoK [Desulfosporosinus]AFQ45553.1 NADH:ubiquinone oxidoreductase subunit 11 or 4L (chain K) [Desulfosporosinus meridiei DSM 13257]KGK90530.1 NADH dehydrogenase [Desulfosporosinus sp. HMP52]SDG08420.1 NADH-quinone oxidoreductase subunit K [Desulfosporosinus hippei DSM 8344]